MILAMTYLLEATSLQKKKAKQKNVELKNLEIGSIKTI